VSQPGNIILLNGTPRCGKTSIARVIQESFPGVWINLGVDNYMAMIPKQFQPGIGLRPGGEGPELEPIIETLYAAMYQSIAAHSRLGVNIVADVGHHDWYSRKLNILRNCARILDGLPAMIVGVRCPIEEIMRRREATWGKGYESDGRVPAPVLRWQEAVHQPGIYDVEVDTLRMSAEGCAGVIWSRLEGGEGLTALRRLGGIHPEGST